MKYYLKVLTLAIVFSFGWGLWWGFYNLEKKNPKYKKGPEIRVLSMKGFFTQDFLKEIETKYKINFVLTEKDSDADLLREALSENKNYDLIQIRSFITKSFLLDSVFKPLDADRIEGQSISIDFKNMGFDPSDKYFVPITWGINGFLVRDDKKLIKESLEELTSNQAQFSVLPSFVELLHLLTKIRPVVKNWLETGQTEELSKDLKQLKTKIAKFSPDPRAELLEKKLDLAQISNGQAAAFIKQNPQFRFVLAKEGSTLWINLLGVSQGVKNEQRTYDVINLLLRDEVNKKLILSNEQATTLNSLNDVDIPPLLKANYIRQVPLSRVDLFVNGEGIEPLWIQAVKKEWSDVMFK